MSPSSPMHHLAEYHAVKFVKKLFGENKIEAILQRLDRLTLDEARATAAQSLEAVYGLVQSMRVVVDGEQAPLGLFLTLDIVPSRWKCAGRGCPKCSRYV